VREFRAVSYGSGRFDRRDFASIGENVVIEPGVLAFKPEKITIGSNVYIGHYAILRGYDRNEMVIGDDTWIGQFCYINSAGGVEIGSRVGIGPCVKFMSSQHSEEGRHVPVLLCDLEFGKITVSDDSDIGIGAVILPGITIGKGAIIGAGAVLTRDVEPYSVVAGVPARKIGERPEIEPA
jgi:acetyltransferase-like isoleucine patch superfamily enzyme